jgi:methyltransferase (TIGR00027 family)
MQPSRTAARAAAYRAAHQILDGASIFCDPLAVAIAGTTEAERIAASGSHGMRLFIAARSRFAEDALAAAVERGVDQLVVLGAGLDTYAYRGEHACRLQIFEVDHPATQTWKRQRLHEIGIAVPPATAFVPVDFGAQSTAQALHAAGLATDRPAFFSWLGVVPYLEDASLNAVLAEIAAHTGGADVVFDYSVPPEERLPADRARYDNQRDRVKALGEPWKSAHSAAAMQAKLHALGFAVIADLGPRALLARYAAALASSAPETGGHVVHAAIEAHPRFIPRVAAEGAR